MATALLSANPPRWELAAETIAVKVRWAGLLIGYVLVNLGDAEGSQRAVLNAILALGGLYALLDTACSLRGRIFLGRYPLFISLMEALFIGLLCYYHGGLESSFRYYYILSLICCSMRHASAVTYTTCGLHCASYALLTMALPPEQRHPAELVLMVVILGWVTWASDAMALLLKRIGDYLSHLNGTLREQQAELEARIALRTQELQEAQAHLLHQEKMAAFGLLAAGIAHEVGNPLTSISSLVQMLQRRDCDGYTRDKLALVGGQLQRIRTTLRELIQFSRPASTESARLSLADVVDEALSIAKYYHRTKGRRIQARIPPDLPALYGVREQLVQVFLNLVLNAIDATGKGGSIELTAARQGNRVLVRVCDDGPGVPAESQKRLFQPYFTTKRHGTGLGLFVTRKLVADHGGTVEFAPGPERGAEFHIDLPLDLGRNGEPAPGLPRGSALCP